MKKIVTFGEVMGRMCPENFLRFHQGMPGKLDMTFAGAEANVASSIAMLGGNVKFVTALPDNEMTEACVSVLQGMNVDTSGIKKAERGRFGLYFVERGANQRPSRVVYDRDYSAVSMMPAEKYNWSQLLNGAKWLHISGVTPALSEISANTTEVAVRTANEMGLTVSCDLNFRKKLWQWRYGISPNKLAERVMGDILPYIDVVIANEEDVHAIMGISKENTCSLEKEYTEAEYEDIAKSIACRYPNLRTIALMFQRSFSAISSTWGAMLYDVASTKMHFSPRDVYNRYSPYEIKDAVDRLGSGDSFSAALIYAMTTSKYSKPEHAIRFAVASSCLSHSINGDFNYVQKSDVELLMNGSVTGRVIR